MESVTSFSTLDPIPLDMNRGESLNSYGDVLQMLVEDNDKSMSLIEKEILELEKESKDGACLSPRAGKISTSKSHFVLDQPSTCSIMQDLELIDASMASLTFEPEELEPTKRRRSSSMPPCTTFLNQCQQDEDSPENKTNKILSAAYSALERSPRVASSMSITEEAMVASANRAIYVTQIGPVQHQMMAQNFHLRPQQAAMNAVSLDTSVSVGMNRLTELMNKTARSQEALRIFESNNPELPVRTKSHYMQQQQKFPYSSRRCSM